MKIYDRECEVVERPDFQSGQLAGASPVTVANFDSCNLNIITNKDEEVWKPVPIKDFCERYKVSNLGRVKNIGLRDQSNRFRRSRTLTMRPNDCGYLCVRLFSAGKPKKNMRVHRLVAMAFIDNPKNLPYINHKDGDKTNNRFNNLEWCNASHNLKHAYQHNLRKKLLGVNNGRFKGPVMVFKNNELIDILHGKIDMINKKYSPDSIYACLSKYNRQKTHKGCEFKRMN